MEMSTLLWVFATHLLIAITVYNYLTKDYLRNKDAVERQCYPYNPVFMIWVGSLAPIANVIVLVYICIEVVQRRVRRYKRRKLSKRQKQKVKEILQSAADKINDPETKIKLKNIIEEHLGH
jgi:cytochrome c-type biogenesis protein CcmH/NrfF